MKIYLERHICLCNFQSWWVTVNRFHNRGLSGLPFYSAPFLEREQVMEREDKDQTRKEGKTEGRVGRFHQSGTPGSCSQMLGRPQDSLDELGDLNQDVQDLVWSHRGLVWRLSLLLYNAKILTLLWLSLGRGHHWMVKKASFLGEATFSCIALPTFLHMNIFPVFH